MNPRSSDDNYWLWAALIALIMVAVVAWNHPPASPGKPVPEDPREIMRQMWEEESSPDDRYLILSGLSAADCIRVGYCELAHDSPVRYLSE